MSRYLTSTKLIDSVKRRASIPANQNTFTNDDFLAFANEEMDMGIIPHVLTFHEDYFVYTELVELQPNQNRYQIPTRAVGNKLRDLCYQDTGGNIFEMSRISIDMLPSYQYNIINSHFSLFYVEGTDIVLVNNSGTTPMGFLRFSYYLRPNQIVSEDRVAIITNINRTTGDITVDQIPSNIDVADTLDLIQTRSPHKTLKLDVVSTGINTTTKTITFDLDDIPDSLVVGDHIALSEETIVPQVPTELHSMLAQRIAARCLESLSDVQGLASANAKLGEMELKTGSLIDSRVDGATQKIVNRHSVLKRKRIYWRK